MCCVVNSNADVVDVLYVCLSSQDKPKKMSLAEIDALVAGIGDVGGDPSDSDEEIDDEELLAELKVLLALFITSEIWECL